MLEGCHFQNYEIVSFSDLISSAMWHASFLRILVELDELNKTILNKIAEVQIKT